MTSHGEGMEARLVVRAADGGYTRRGSRAAGPSPSLSLALPLTAEDTASCAGTWRPITNTPAPATGPRRAWRAAWRRGRALYKACSAAPRAPRSTTT